MLQPLRRIMLIKILCLKAVPTLLNTVKSGDKIEVFTAVEFPVPSGTNRRTTDWVNKLVTANVPTEMWREVPINV